MKSDVERWNGRYASQQHADEIQPDPVLVESSSLLAGSGYALDLASGTCDNALYLAKRGYTVVAIDASYIALQIGKRKAEINSLDLNYLVADLDAYPLPHDLFDVVVVVRYLNRGIIESIRHALKKGGLLLFKTFNVRFLDQKPSFPAAYVLEDGELSRWFGDWACIATNDSRPGSESQSYWVGRRT